MSARKAYINGCFGDDTKQTKKQKRKTNMPVCITEPQLGFIPAVDPQLGCIPAEEEKRIFGETKNLVKIA